MGFSVLIFVVRIETNKNEHSPKNPFSVQICSTTNPHETEVLDKTISSFAWNGNNCKINH